MYRDVYVLDVPGNDEGFIQSRLRDCALTLYRDANNINGKNLSKEEHTVLNDLIKNKASIIQR